MYSLFGLNFYDGNLNSLVKSLCNDIETGKKSAVFTPNIDHIINNSNDSKVKDIYAKGEYIIADGWPLVATGKLKGKLIYRITGVDLMDKLLEVANDRAYNIYFLGATDTTLDKLRANIINKYPNIKNIRLNNGFFKDSTEVISDINKDKVNILFVGMGNPKQELWIKENFDLINANLMLAVGGAFNIFSGDVGRAPNWIQKIGMEWFYRFLKEPKRLFYRYFIKYPKFIKIFFKEFFNES
ncbi:MAG: WecB/TagA/CpsF family glycosyltransferase [Clostridium sp.]|uniref:WecB/TagA/CpsF family glycosyltransferase n=1 Tax=Clostridium sp. TaxID=1506 RepID=UPI0025B96177|nr:WecB/TagA/CpsF family glycosyltransferase [Clostridium sp.]MCF0149556.1 WecB/TagA/CpsF family glycosyltransferase [Clostridium sp.]